MIFQNSPLIINLISIIFSFIATILAIILLTRIKEQKETKTKFHLERYILLIVIGISINILSEIILPISSIFFNLNKIIFDITETIGWLTIIAGLLYFVLHLYKEEELLKKGISKIISLTTLVTLITIYIISRIINNELTNSLEKIIYYINPLMIIITSLLLLLIAPFFKEFKKIKNPLLLFALSTFLEFISVVLYIYITPKSSNTIIYSHILKATSNLISLIGFYLLIKNWAKEE